MTYATGYSLPAQEKIRYGKADVSYQVLDFSFECQPVNDT